MQSLDRFIWPGGNEPKPETNQNYVRMYSHNLCPYVARARFAFACKEIPYQEVFIDLNDKGQWHKDFNGGLVPVLEMPTGDLIPESGIAMQFAIESAPSGQGIDLIPADPILAAEMRVKIAEHDKDWWTYMLPIYLSRFRDYEAIDKCV